MAKIIKSLFFLINVIVVFVTTVCLAGASELSQIDFEKIDQFVESEMKGGHIPGVGLGIVKGDKILYLKGYGIADENKRPVTPKTPFGLGSISKTFTALAIRQLAGEDKIDLEEPANKYIPWFRTADLNESEKIRIIDLIEHKSGFSNASGNEAWLYNTRYSLEELVRKLKGVKLNRPVGTSSEYSNINYVVLGLIVEKVSGKPYGEYIKEKIFAPLDMSNSYTSQKEAEKNGMARGFGVRFGFTIPYNPKYPEGQTPAGFLISSAEDMTRYMMAYISRGYYKGQSIIQNNSLMELKADEPYDSKYYGIYWMPQTGYPHEYRNSFCHVGGWVNNHATLMVIPHKKIGIIVLTNTRNDYIGPAKNSTTILNGVADIVSGDAPPAPSDLGFTGRYIVFNIITLAALLFIIWHAAMLKSFKRKISQNKVDLTKSGVAILVINFLIPVYTLLNLFALGNDYGYAALAGSIVLITCGIIKIIWIGAACMTSVNTGKQ